MNDAAAEGTFMWVSGEPVGYTNWLPGQPNASPFGEEDYVHLLRPGLGAVSGFWNDMSSPNLYFPAFSPLHGVVEVAPAAAVPEPGALVCALVLAGAAAGFGCLHRNRRVLSK